MNLIRIFSELQSSVSLRSQKEFFEIPLGRGRLFFCLNMGISLIRSIALDQEQQFISVFPHNLFSC